MNEGGSDLDLEAMLAAAEALDNAGGEEAEVEVISANDKGDARPGDADGKSEGAGDGTEAGEGSAAGDSDDTKEESSQTGEDGEGTAEGEGEGGKKDSAYTRAKKSEERLGKTWEQVNAEKQRLAEEKAQLEREKAELQRLREEGHRKPEQQVVPRSAEDYEAAAAEFEKDGDTDLANAARQQAAQVREAQHRAAWAQEANSVVSAAENADLRNLESPLSKEVQKLLKDGPYLQMKGGFARAVEDARVRLDAGSLPSLKSENAKLKQELEKANRRLGLAGSQPAPAAPAKKAPAAGDLLAAARALDEQGIAVAG